MILFYFVPTKISYEPLDLSLVLYLIFICIPAFFIALVTSRGFIRTGSWPLLWLGIGALSFGITNVLSSFLLTSTFSTLNNTITVGNLNILIASILYIIGGFFTFNDIKNLEKSNRSYALLQVYIGALIAIIIVTIISLKGLFPPFFIQGVGGTIFRDFVLGTSAIFFFLTSLMILRVYSKSKSLMLYWFGLGLLLITVGIVGSIFVHTLGSPFNWFDRLAELLGGVYLIIATLVVRQTAKIKKISVVEALSNVFVDQESTMNLLLENISEAIFICDINFIITGWNKGAEKIYGWQAKEAIGQSTELLQANYSLDKQDVLNHIIKQGSWTGESQQKTKDGKDIFILGTISAIKDDSNNITGYLSINHDFTEKKETEDKLLFQADILSRVQDAIVANDEKFKIIYWNKIAEKMFGWTEEEVLGKYTGDILQTKIENSSRNIGLEKLLEEGHFEGEVCNKRKDNTYLPVDLNSKVSYNEKGEMTGVLSSVRDISERKHNEKELKETMDRLIRSNKELERFAYVSSHDLQEPLRMVTLFSQLLEKRYKDKLDKDANEFIEYIVEGSQRMKQLIDDLLEYSRVDSQAKEFENVNLENVLDNVLTNLSISIVEYNVTISHDPLPVVNGDKNQLMQVFQNLVINAIKFHGQNTPEINIHVQKKENEWIFAVEDNGIGIDVKHQKQIFEVFKRLQHNRDEYPGSGIGLSITQKIIIHHGGRIWVESELGKGSTFYFTIPTK